MKKRRKAEQSMVGDRKKKKNILKRNSKMYRDFDSMPVEKDLIFFESRNGRDFAGNILRIAMEIRDRFPERYRMYASIRPQRRDYVQKILSRYGLEDITLVRFGSVEHIRLLHRAGYLVNDAAFQARFIKRPGQVYLNTRHGTPLKKMGLFSRADWNRIDNAQRNFYASDYILFSNEDCADKIVSAFDLEGMLKSEFLWAGYPRNDVFKDPAVKDKMRREYGLEDKRVYAYLPTYREESRHELDSHQSDRILGYLREIDRSLEDDEVFYLKLHYNVSTGLDLKEMKHLRPFPDDVEANEFLAATDALVSDYSGAMLDYALTGNKIVRFAYDREEYESDRGLYEDIATYPFPVVREVPELIKELRSEKNYEDNDFLERYCTRESGSAAREIVEKVFSSEKGEGTLYKNRRRHIFYAGDLRDEEMAEKLEKAVRDLPDDTDAYICLCRQEIQGMRDKSILDSIPQGAKVYCINGDLFKTYEEAVADGLYRRGLRIGAIKKIRRGMIRREWLRSFGVADFSDYTLLDKGNGLVNELFAYGRRRNKK